MKRRISGHVNLQGGEAYNRQIRNEFIQEQKRRLVYFELQGLQYASYAKLARELRVLLKGMGVE